MADVLFELIGSFSESSSEGASDSSCEGISESNREPDKRSSQPPGRRHQRNRTELTVDDLRQIPISK